MSDIPIDPQVLLRLQHLASVGEISAGVSHETRNLMTAIAGFAQVAKQRASEPEAVQRYVGLIEREAMRCIELLEHFLELSRVDATNSELVEIDKVIEHVAGIAGHQIELARIALRTDVPALPPVRGRKNELQQVILNLAINAMHATPSGGTIVIAAAHAPPSVEITVTDSGTGVPPALRDKIFEAFFTTKDRGTGLGLSLCRRLVGAHGGSLELDPEYLQGARFVVRLPVA
jgi:signal transduction histidine kinase